MTKNEAIREADRRGYHCDEWGGIYNPDGRKLNPYQQNRYLAFSLRAGDRVVKIPVHRFIAFQLHGEVIFRDGVEVRHLDNDSTNNSWHNIGFGTSKQNKRDIPKQQRSQRAQYAAMCRWARVA